MPLVGTALSIDRLLGLHLFDSAFSVAGQKIRPPISANRAASTATNRPARPAALSTSSSSSASSFYSSRTSSSSHSLSSALTLLGFIARNAEPSSTVPSPPGSTASPLSSPIATWPMAQLPVEIFEIITRYLSRADIQALRLVCREFEAKVSAQYFRNVVVPFRSELYTNLDRDENNVIASRLFSSGMRIFESFGPHILRFALSLELDEFTLAYPPVKPAQEAVPAFWGIYRWPHETYHRYTDLEGLEQTADETDSMKKALRCLTKVTNLGLCCDAGLGFLVGPDQAQRKISNPDPVFGTRDWRPDGRSRNHEATVTVSDFNGVPRDLTNATAQHDNFKRRILEKMIADAGFAGFYVHEAIDLLLETEGVTISNIDFDEREAIWAANHHANPLPPIPARHRRTADTLAQQEREQEQAAAQEANSRQPLIPTNLTRAQKELLLELEWAHRAMIQSYVISIIDNAGDGCFRNLTNVTIAKIPSAHIHIFCRKELWESLPCVKNVSIAVIADWRKISKPSPGVVADTHMSPVEAVPKAYKLLNDYIGRRDTIENVHFEWICGGEFARGPYQRGQYILPAPFVESADMMSAPDGAKDTDKLLAMPFVKHFSLKNCWVSPHVLMQTIRSMALRSLDKLEFESVSLSGPPVYPLQPGNVPQPALDDGGIPPALFQGLVGPMAGGPVAPPPIFPPVAMPMQMLLPEEQQPERLAMPDLFTWSGFCEHFSPSIKMRYLPRFRESAGVDGDTTVRPEELSLPHPNKDSFLPYADQLNADEAQYNLSSISFKSCGYVFIDLRTLEIRALLPPEGQAAHAFANSLRHDMFHSMQYCKDKLLGRILPYMLTSEVKTLEQIFLMDHGWSKVYPSHVCDDAIADGFEMPGLGRFSGTLAKVNDNQVEMIG
ncbi:hypothetical protein M431DRAFT_93107 [Trichoderma harzianum CBS 226.95]|uniref:F-box domain-containing protein n=1 Tax=Trichoderma harzianum CBS 226.95 TaxID=983964 RepID=A0A2T4A1Y9_TRIHA|nr:hypothetical protein M431DRAFT_93107 [Trichoderma harzianum CBS 226.95]PTB51074.1 hypothetical protein M431DRAFT_93107 [Trichoderma harzianum CBS 226.95]